MPIVTTTSVALGKHSCLVQNLGPDTAYIGELFVTEDNGLQLPPGMAVSVGFVNSSVYVVSEGTSDIRTLGGGTGIFSAEAPA